MSTPPSEAAPGPSYTFRLNDLPKLDLQIDRGTDFIGWRLQWRSYCSLSGLAQQEASKQVEALSLCFSRETLSIVQNLGLTTEQRNDVTTIIEALQSYVDGHLNEIIERRNFGRRVQQPGESFDDFLIALRELAKTCKFCSDACTEDIRDQVIEGASDGDTIEDLLQENNLTLAKTISMGRSREAAKKHRSDIHVPDLGMVAALHQRSQQPTQMCSGCGSNMYKGGRQQCPPYNQVCISCHKVGHFAKVCRSRAFDSTLETLYSRHDHRYYHLTSTVAPHGSWLFLNSNRVLTPSECSLSITARLTTCSFTKWMTLPQSQRQPLLSVFHHLLVPTILTYSQIQEQTFQLQGRRYFKH